ncbi:MAG: primosomal protein N' [Lautropia sp.]|nr:primosomal protein N' [Lautropia sp.]
MSLPFIQVLIDGPLAGSFAYRCPGNTSAPAPSSPDTASATGARAADKPTTHTPSPDASSSDTTSIRGTEAAAGINTVPLRPEAAIGHWVTVPWGKGRRTGLAVSVSGEDSLPAGLSADSIRPIEAVRDDIPAPPPDWLPFLRFVATYYHGNLADLAVGTLPKLLRTPPTARSRKTAHQRLAAFSDTHALHAPAGLLHEGADAGGVPTLTAAQQAVLDALCQPPPGKPRPWLLHGITGSGKTEVYLHWMAHLLQQDPHGQVLLLVPEIGLTPAVQRQLQQRFPDQTIAILHSEMTDAARASHWLAAASGTARIVLGTRLAVLAPLPRLRAIIIDEEHDPSYKQQEGLRYSARDMAVARASLAGLPILLGSATPSMESWHNAHQGRYRLLSLTQRARSNASLPSIELVSLRGARTREGLAEESLHAIHETLARKEQALLFLNRRGYAPVLSCDACGWLSRCDRCDAYRVLHRAPGAGRPDVPRRYHLICHHCGTGQAVPRACPACGNQDLAPLGRGTQKLEDALASLFPDARIGRLDADVARRRGATEAFLSAVHAGETDLLVGTQMLAKGHDFDRLTLVVVVDADAGLFTTNFRAPERSFATLMQVAGRAGRHRSQHARTLIQTRHPELPIFAALRRHDYPAFAQAQLQERELGGLPPYGYQALITAQARDMESALTFLQDSCEYLLSLQNSNYVAHQLATRTQHHHVIPDSESRPLAGGSAPPTQHQAGSAHPDPRAHPHRAPEHHAVPAASSSATPVPPSTTPVAQAAVNICDPVPMPLAQINHVCRAQLLVESSHRQSLHILLAAWEAWVAQRGEAARAGKAGNRRHDLRWQLIIDPQEI